MLRSARLLVLAATAALLGWPNNAAAQQVRISKLVDMSGPITNFAADTVAPQSVCAFSSATGRRYSVTASTNTGNVLALSSGTRTLPLEVQWSGQAGQTVGTPLAANVKSIPFTSAATTSGCTSGPLTSATLILIVRATEASRATAGTYSGTLTLLVAPE